MAHCQTLAANIVLVNVRDIHEGSDLMLRTFPELNPTPWSLDYAANFASFSKDGNRLTLYGPNGLTVVYIPQSKTLLSLTKPKSVTQPALISPDGSTVLVVSGDISC